MPDEYNSMVTALKVLTQGEEPNTATLPMAADEWNPRPETVSYGIVLLQFEADALRGDDRKQSVAYSGSVHLFSMKRDGAGWVPLIRGVLDEYCDCAWSLNYHTYERETGLFHWEWTFQIEG